MYAAAQFAETLDGLEAAACHRCERKPRRHQQIAESLAVAAPHASAQLVELREPEVLRIVNYDGVDIGHVDTALYDGGGYEYVIVVVGKVYDGLLEFLGRHLAVPHNDAGIGHKAFHLGLEVIKPLDAVVDDEHLAVARQFEVDSLADDVVAPGVDRCDDGIAVGRRGVDGREVARSHE